MDLINVFKEIFEGKHGLFANDFAEVFCGQNVGVVLAGPGDATTFLVCRTPRLG